MCVLLILLASASGGTQTLAAVEDLPPAIVLKPLFAQRVQILDVAVLDSRGLLVLDRSALTRYERGEPRAAETMPAWRRVESVSLPARAWPRDFRGHLQRDSGAADVIVPATGALLAVLPGTTCTVSFSPLRMACAERRTAWGYGLPNGGLEPGRNYFTMPEGLTAYGAASFFDLQGGLVADRQGRLVQLDENRRPIADLGAGDDVIPVRSSCLRGHPGYYLAASHGSEGDVLRAFRVDGDRLVPAAPDFPLPGAFTALSSVDQAAIVITRLPGVERYDAFQADLSCGR